MNDPFIAIRHYSEKEAIEAIHRVFNNEDFLQTLKAFEPNICVDGLRKRYKEYKSIYDFQIDLAKDFVQYFIEKTTAGVTFSGLENIDKNKSYLYLANHRDIVFDTAILQYYFFLNQYPTSKIAIGDNLLSTSLLTEIGKINKMIVVKRAVSIREKLMNYKLLSDYLRHSILVERDSVWIAQRNGRTKDGIDKTQHGLVKMFTMSDAKNIIKTLKELNIVPVTISYEYESCDHLKARELALSENQNYVKKEGEDFESIKQGLFGQKGKINLVIGKPLNETLDTFPKDLNHKELIEEVCLLADQQIYSNYKLYPNNYIAYDLLEKSQRFSNQYSEEEKTVFLNYLDKQSLVKDVSKDKMLLYLLQIYANPVKTSYREN